MINALCTEATNEWFEPGPEVVSSWTQRPLTRAKTAELRARFSLPEPGEGDKNSPQTWPYHAYFHYKRAALWREWEASEHHEVLARALAFGLPMPPDSPQQEALTALTFAYLGHGECLPAHTYAWRLVLEAMCEWRPLVCKYEPSAETVAEFQAMYATYVADFRARQAAAKLQHPEQRDDEIITVDDEGDWHEYLRPYDEFCEEECDRTYMTLDKHTFLGVNAPLEFHLLNEARSVHRLHGDTFAAVTRDGCVHVSHDRIRKHQLFTQPDKIKDIEFPFVLSHGNTVLRYQGGHWTKVGKLAAERLVRVDAQVYAQFPAVGGAVTMVPLA